MAKKKGRKRVVVPRECGFLAALLYQELEEARGGDQIWAIRDDILAAAAFLADVPPEVQIRDMDILSEHDWPQGSKALIRAVTE